MTSWVPLPKVGRLAPPVFTPWDNPLHKSLCQVPRPQTPQRLYSDSQAHEYQGELTSLAGAAGHFCPSLVVS